MVVRTRSASGAIARTRYDSKTLKQRAEVPLERARKGNSGFQPHIEDHIPMPPMEDLSEGCNFVPPTAFGEQLEKGLSIIGYAKRHVQQWEIIKKAHLKHMPHLVPQIHDHVEKAKEDLQALLDDEENYVANSTVINLKKRDEKVARRIECLERCLQTCEFPPEAENIQAAIDGYRNGGITYSEEYTIIWAGKIVDRAKSYGEFKEDRQARLDRYCEEYGPHWLWYESPLNVHPNNIPRASRHSVLSRNVSDNGLGQYYTTLLFWKRAGWVTRLPLNSNAPPTPHSIKEYFIETAEGLAFCQFEGPKCAYVSLLDSGATYPSLYMEDFRQLGVNSRIYAAQSIVTLSTANGVVDSRIYEMFVNVTDSAGQQLVDANDAVWPYHGKYLGGLCPVAVCGEVQPPPDENGFRASDRLSGIMPFLACYVSSTPTRNRLYLGEDRNDVLGSQRVPGHRRWDISMSSYQVHDMLSYSLYGDPKITFTHRDGRIVEVDRTDIAHASYTIVEGGTPREYVLDHNPGGACDAARARQEAEEATRNPQPFHNVGVRPEDVPPDAAVPGGGAPGGG